MAEFTGMSAGADETIVPPMVGRIWGQAKRILLEWRVETIDYWGGI